MKPITILAPGTLHLPLYAKMYEMLGNTTNIRLLSLDSWLREQVEFPIQNNLSLLYQYRKQLSSLSAANSFFESREDYDFLRDCLDFMSKFFLYELSIEDLPQNTKRDKDLLEVISLLKDIPRIEQAYVSTDFERLDLSGLWILDKNYSIEEIKILERLKKGGARVLKSIDEISGFSMDAANPSKDLKTNPDKDPLSESLLPINRYYWSTSNPRTQMEIIADTIITENMSAEDIFIVLSRPEDASVLSQVFEARKIPLTLMSEPSISPVLSQWKAALLFVADKSRENLMNLLKELYPQTSTQLRNYMDLFPEGSDLEHLEYAPNPLISEFEFENMRSMELQMQPWLPIFEKMKTWKANDATMLDIGDLIQKANPSPSEDDIRIFDGISRLYGDVRSEIHSELDLPLLIRHLDSLYPNSALSECTGVLAGSKKEISPLHKTVFYTGADAAHFPAFSMNGGIFDEAYMQKIKKGYPSLSDRLSLQRNALFHSLEIPKELYVMGPQAEYEGKSSDTSYEMFTWMNAHPKFQHWKDSSWYIKPDFSLSEEISSQLFFPEKTFNASLSSLNAYDMCPLKHMLQYGLKLKKPYVLEERLEVKAEILKDVIESSNLWYQRPVWALSKEEVRFLVSRQFEFARKVFKDKTEALEILELEYVQKILEMVRILRPITKKLNASLIPDQAKIKISENKDGMQMDIEGFVNRSSKNRTPFLLVNPENGETSGSCEITPDSDQNDRSAFHEAMAALDVSLSQKPIQNKAFSISMGRGKKPVCANEFTHEQLDQEFITQFLKDAIKGQNMPETDTFEGEVIRKKTPSYEKTMEQARSAADDFIKSLSHGCVLPLHKANACKFCAFKSICRNGSQERTQESTRQAFAEYDRKNELAAKKAGKADHRHPVEASDHEDQDLNETERVNRIDASPVI
ncbi:hypothetical protein [Ileibacterium valens]|uniref:hypothetical protein n=1 Tax=Ileibacterium valens TaxID=1862668 RepID=UPI00272A2098|nr:hypothetical protein [Ileibacterium valens]